MTIEFSKIADSEHIPPAFYNRLKKNAPTDYPKDVKEKVSRNRTREIVKTSYRLIFHMLQYIVDSSSV